jgi:hypothetical protein
MGENFLIKGTGYHGRWLSNVNTNFQTARQETPFAGCF